MIRKSTTPNVCILSRKKTLYSTRRLIQVAREQGYRPWVLDSLRCYLLVENGKPQIWCGAEQIPRPNMVIPRIGASITTYGLTVVGQFEAMGVPILNGSQAIARSRDKLRCLQLLASAGLGIPKTIIAHRRAKVPQLAEQIGGLPAIVKLLQGTQGVGVMIANSLEELSALLNTFWDLGQDILLQQFIREAQGSDIRALVVGGKVVGAMRRQAKDGEFRSNIHRGAKGIPIDLPNEYIQTAIKAAQIMGLELAGVDLLESNDGPMVMEVNSSPGFEGLERTTQIDIAAIIIRRAMEIARH